MINLIFPWVIVLIFLSFITTLIKSPWFKGKLGETWTRIIGKINLDKKIYHQIHDVTLPAEDGTTQIDHIIISKFGIFVIETKNMSGWIFGDQYSQTWTQTKNKQKYKFQNPLRQNHKHIKVLKNILAIDESKIFSIIAFVGDAKLKTELPENVTVGSDYVRYIRSKNTPIIKEHDIEEIIERIEKNRLERSFKTEKQHIEYLEKKFTNSEKKGNVYMKKAILKIVIILALFAGMTEVLKNKTKPTPTPDLRKEIKAEIKKTEEPNTAKIPQSSEFGILKLSAHTDTFLTLYDQNNSKKILSIELKKGKLEEVEIKKGYYTAEILQTGKRKIQSVSFIGNIGNLDL